MWGRQPLVTTVLDKPLDNPRMEQRGLGLTDLLPTILRWVLGELQGCSRLSPR
jgi:hypothetical protein